MSANSEKVVFSLDVRNDRAGLHYNAKLKLNTLVDDVSGHAMLKMIKKETKNGKSN